MLTHVKELPPNYAPAGGVSIKKLADLTQMVIWSIVLPLICILAILLILSANGALSGSFSFSGAENTLKFLGGILLLTVVMLALHEGLHGLVFWLTTREAPKFEFKWYYASASPGDWYLPSSPFMLATLLTFGAIAWFAASVGQALQRAARAQQTLNWLAGAVFLGLAARLALSER
jgi:hypothetical protein